MKTVTICILLFIISFSAEAQIILYYDNFDTYSLDEGLIQQSEVWSYWSDDAVTEAFVTNTNSLSQPNSIRLDENETDIVFPIGPFISGNYEVEFQIYVPGGEGAYISFLHEWTNNDNNYSWASEALLHSDGFLEFNNGVNSILTPFPFDQWVQLRLYANLDNDLAKFYLNGSLISEWQWSMDVGTGSQGLNQIAGVGFYGFEGTSYVDNFSLVKDPIESSGTECSDLFFSEIVEGSANNKAVEIYNPTPTAIDASEYGIIRYMGNENDQISWLTDVVIEPYDTYVIVLEKLDPLGVGPEVPVDLELQAVADTFMNPNYDFGIWPMYFNGNDPVALVKDEGQTLVDLFGKIGEGIDFFGWGPYLDSEGNQSYMSMNHTLVRKCNVSQGVITNPSTFDLLAEWDTLSMDTYSDLGKHNSICAGTCMSEPPCALVYNFDENMFEDMMICDGDEIEICCGFLVEDESEIYGQWQVFGPDDWELTSDSTMNTIFSPNDVGSYQLCFSDEICDGFYCLNVEYNSTPDIDFTQNEIHLCEDDQIVLCAVTNLVDETWPTYESANLNVIEEDLVGPLYCITATLTGTSGNLEVFVENVCGQDSSEIAVYQETFDFEIQMQGDSLSIVSDPFLDLETACIIWYLNGTDNVGTGPSIQPLLDGYYSATIMCTPFNCTYYVNEFFYVGIDRIENTGLSVTPNPTGSECTISAASGNINRIELFEMCGRSVIDREIAYPNSSQEIIDLSKLPEGVYFAKVIIENSMEVLRIVVQR